MDFTITPARLEIDNAIVSLDLAGGPEHWVVTVMLSRPPESAPLSATDLAVRAIGPDGSETPPFEQPAGNLTEFGGSLGTTANARYVFAGKAWPRSVTVRFADRVAEFAVSAAAR